MREAILLVSRELLEQAILDYESATHAPMVPAHHVAYAKEIVGLYHDALKLPGDCRITGIGVEKDKMSFLIESPDFVETVEGNALLKVEAVYRRQETYVRETNKVTVDVSSTAPFGYFLRWDGPAVAVKRTYEPSGKEVTSFSDAARTEPVGGTSKVTVDVSGAVKPVDKKPLVEGKRVAYTPGDVPCKACGNLLLGRLTEMELCPECAGNPWTENPPTYKGKGLPVQIEDEIRKVVPTPPGNCWRCGNPVKFKHSHKLSSGEWECEECAEKSLL